MNKFKLVFLLFVLLLFPVLVCSSNTVHIGDDINNSIGNFGVRQFSKPGAIAPSCVIPGGSTLVTSSATGLTTGGEDVTSHNGQCIYSTP